MLSLCSPYALCPHPCRQVYPAEQLLVIPSERLKEAGDMKHTMGRFARFMGLSDSGAEDVVRLSQAPSQPVVGVAVLVNQVSPDPAAGRRALDAVLAHLGAGELAS